MRLLARALILRMREGLGTRFAGCPSDLMHRGRTDGVWCGIEDLGRAGRFHASNFGFTLLMMMTCTRPSSVNLQRRSSTTRICPKRGGRRRRRRAVTVRHAVRQRRGDVRRTLHGHRIVAPLAVVRHVANAVTPAAPSAPRTRSSPPAGCPAGAAPSTRPRPSRAQACRPARSPAPSRRRRHSIAPFYGRAAHLHHVLLSLATGQTPNSRRDTPRTPRIFGKLHFASFAPWRPTSDRNIGQSRLNCLAGLI